VVLERDDAWRREMRRVPDVPLGSGGLEAGVSGGEPVFVDATDVGPVVWFENGDGDRATRLNDV